MARLKDPKAIADKYKRNAGAAVKDYTDGVNAVTVAPGQLAAAKEEKWRSGVNDSYVTHRWRDNTAAVPLESWRKATTIKGATNFTVGVNAAADKVIAFQTDLQDAQATIDRELANMPDDTPEQRIQRAITQMTLMCQFKGRLGTKGR